MVQWLMSYGREPRHSFECADSNPLRKSTMPTTAHPKLDQGHRYTARVEVRRDALRAFIGGTAVAEFRGEVARLSVPAHLRPRDSRTLALTALRGVEFHKAEVTEFTGRGTLTRPAAAAPFPPLDAVWVKTVQALPLNAKIREVAADLKRRNPGFDGQVRHVPLKEGPSLKMTSDDIVDLTPLRAVAGLGGLKVQGSEPRAGKLTDLSPLVGLKLVRLHVTNCKVRDLTPLKGMPLHALTLTGTEVRDLAALRGLEYLESLNLHFNLQLTDLAPLADTRLKHIALRPAPNRLPGLRAIKTLETINDQPVAEFWKEHDTPPQGGKGP
jgi:hypothetical protein